MIEIQALMMYWYWTDPMDIFLAVYGEGRAETYVRGKVGVIHRGLSHFWTILDYPHRRKLVDAAREKYWDAAAEQVTREMVEDAK